MEVQTDDERFDETEDFEETEDQTETEETIEELKKFKIPRKLNSKLKDNESFYSTELTKLLRVKLTQVEMIEDRGYNIEDDTEFKTLDYQGFYKKFKENNIFQIFSSLSKIYNGEIFVFYPIPTNKQLSANDIDIVFKMIAEKNSIRKYIVIAENNPSSELKKQINNIEARRLFKDGIRIQIFNYNELLWNPSKHFLVPKHIVLTDEEKDDLMKIIDINNLPLILTSDRQSKYIGAEDRQVIKIIRKNINPYSDNIIDTSIGYRLVVNE